jgi:GST-like protein
MLSSVKDWAPTKTLEDLTNRAASAMGWDTSKSYSQVHEDLPEGSAPIQLYSLGTPEGIKVSILLEELELQYDAHVIDISKGDQFKSGFLDINPNGKIPALMDKDGPGGKRVDVWECGAIIVYLAKKYNKFIPRDPVLEAECMNWGFWAASELGPTVTNFKHFFLNAPNDQGQARDYCVHRFGCELTRLMTVLDKHLQGRSYMSGETYGIADIAIFPFVRYLRFESKHESGVNVNDYLQLEKFKNVIAWSERINNRPAVQRGLEVCKAQIDFTKTEKSGKSGKSEKSEKSEKRETSDEDRDMQH